jgi:23S rRNA (cytosine1962-C5)-methyltransferase
MKEGVVLKKGKEVIFENKHLWIFSGAIFSFPKDFKNGQIYKVFDFQNKKLGFAFFNKEKSLCGRILSFDEKEPKEAVFDHIDRAISLRESIVKSQDTNSYRLINGEADFLPGLIVDQYNEYLVLQSGCLGMDLLKEQIVSFLAKKGKWKGIFEKSSGSSRKEESLKESIGVLYGEDKESIEILENGITFIVDWRKGQKTGFFLDQREMRKKIESLSCGKKVLNCFCYSGGFSLYAAKGGALHVDSIDISAQAIEWVQHNFKLNPEIQGSHSEKACDAFKFLEEDKLDYDLIILDPPAFAKKKQDIPSASKGYREINYKVLSKIPPKSFLLTCSCSYYMEESLFQTLIFQAAKMANREVQIISKHLLGADHPINLFHKESSYLKSFLLYIN